MAASNSATRPSPRGGRLIAGFIAVRPTLDDTRVHDSAGPAVSPRVRRTTGASIHVRGDPELRSGDDLPRTCHPDSPKLRSGRPRLSRADRPAHGEETG